MIEIDLETVKRVLDFLKGNVDELEREELIEELEETLIGQEYEDEDLDDFEDFETDAVQAFIRDLELIFETYSAEHPAQKRLIRSIERSVNKTVKSFIERLL